jgi:hypothetical protein
VRRRRQLYVQIKTKIDQLINRSYKNDDRQQQNDYVRRRRQLYVQIKTKIDLSIDRSYKNDGNQSRGYNDSTYQAKNDKNENESIEQIDDSNFSQRPLHAADKNKCRILIP